MQWIVFLALISVSAALRVPYPKAKTHVFEGEAAGKTLILTPYLKTGNAKTARDLALVTELQPNITSYSGYFTVNEECGSNLYFWFFPSQNNPATDPVSVWLQGGPGSTSFFGLLTENGPYNLKTDGTLELREYSWNRNSSVIYIDNPVGTGYSYTTGGCYADDETQVGQDLLSAFEQFFQVFPELSKNDFYITGESYAGKYVPAAAYAIYKSNSSINLKGIMIGNGLVDSRNQQDYSSYVYQLGFIDENTKQLLAAKEQEVRDQIDSGNFEEGSNLMNEVLYIFELNSGIRSLYNYLFAYGEPDQPDIDAFVTQTSVRQALHVGNATWNDGGLVYQHLSEDTAKSVAPWLEELLEKYRVLLYNGQLDIICAYPLTVDFVRLLKWSGSEEYLNSVRNIWMVGERLAGYSKTVGDFTEVLVRSAGHMVPADQPEWALDLYNRFIFNQQIGEVANGKNKL